MRSPLRRDERGFALAEVVIAIGIIGLALTTLVGAYAIGVRSTDRHRDLTYVNVTANLVSEWLAGQSYSTSGTYSVPTADQITYPPGWGPSNVTVATDCWTANSDPPTFGACGSDTRLQRVRITLSSGGHDRIVEIMKRNPA
jgi:type II secretory pathway pseudopilin PulG